MVYWKIYLFKFHQKILKVLKILEVITTLVEVKINLEINKNLKKH